VPHKTLYIDIDEEITSIVDRVRKTPADEVIVVVPKRALLIQSIVNLKLLKKEASRRKKRLMIWTQDRIGKKLIEKAGILVQGKMDDSLADEEIFEDKPQRARPATSGDFAEDEEENVIGSSDYFDEPLPAPKSEENIGKISFEKRKNDPGAKSNLQEVKKPGKEAKPKSRRTRKGSGVRISDIVAGPKSEKEKRPKSQKPAAMKKKETSSAGGYFHSREMERQKGLEPEKFFQVSNFTPPSFSSRKEERALKTTRVKGRAGKYFVFFLVAFFVFGTAAGAYFFLPRAPVVLHLRTEEKSVSLAIEANTQTNGIDEAKKSIPAALEPITKEKSGEFDATGNQTGAGKATGKVVIYNEFSSESQPLGTTTRLETSDGKIFRITKGIVVPGLTQVSGETKPGAIEVEVMAGKQ